MRFPLLASFVLGLSGVLVSASPLPIGTSDIKGAESPRNFQHLKRTPRPWDEGQAGGRPETDEERIYEDVFEDDAGAAPNRAPVVAAERPNQQQAETQEIPVGDADKAKAQFEKTGLESDRDKWLQAILDRVNGKGT